MRMDLLVGGVVLKRRESIAYALHIEFMWREKEWHEDIKKNAEIQEFWLLEYCSPSQGISS